MTTSYAINLQSHSPQRAQGKGPPLIYYNTNRTSKSGNDLSKQDQEMIVKKLHISQQSSVEVEVDQLEDLLEDERSIRSKSYQKKAYIKFANKDVRTLEANFEKNNYPDLGEMKTMAGDFGVGLLKVENWYKHHRRSLAKRGQFDIKTKKHFDNLEVNYLMEVFQNYPKPTFEQIKIAYF